MGTGAGRKMTAALPGVVSGGCQIGKIQTLQIWWQRHCFPQKGLLHCTAINSLQLLLLQTASFSCGLSPSLPIYSTAGATSTCTGQLSIIWKFSAPFKIRALKSTSTFQVWLLLASCLYYSLMRSLSVSKVMSFSVLLIGDSYPSLKCFFPVCFYF